MTTSEISIAPELAWRKSSYSGAEGGQCVEVAVAAAGVHVRDSKDVQGHVLTVSPRAWGHFIGHHDV